VSRNNSVGIATGCELDGHGSIPDSGRDFSLLTNVNTGSGAHPASYPVSTDGQAELAVHSCSDHS
jgi:hypothetical protein